MPILLAYDGKPYTEKALDYAIDHALAYSQPLYIVATVTSKDEMDREKELEDVKVHLDAAKQKAADKGVEVRALIEAGNVSEAILATAERLEAKTIIVGYHDDRTVLDRVVLGSVSEHIIRNAKCTVIIVQ